MVKVSVIIPVFNTYKYISECLNSVLNQSLKNIEIICIDDGSTDESAYIIDEYARKNDNIFIIHQQNYGYGYTVNKGIEQAHGEYVGIVDSDDFISMQMYDKLYKLAKKSNADVVRCDICEIKRKKYGYKKKPVFISDYYLRKNELFAEIPFEKSFNYVGMNAWGAIYKLCFLKENNIKFNESSGASFQDNGFWFQANMYAKKIMHMRGTYYYYRKDNPDSSINDKNKVYNICGEYKYIKDIVLKNKSNYKGFFIFYIIQKYYAYMDSYNRIAEKYKLKFLRHIAVEFDADLKILYSLNLELNEKDMYPLGEIIRITDSPEIYYYESSIDRLRREYCKVNRDLSALKQTFEYMAGKKLMCLFKFSKYRDKGNKKSAD